MLLVQVNKDCKPRLANSPWVLFPSNLTIKAGPGLLTTLSHVTSTYVQALLMKLRLHLHTEHEDNLHVQFYEHMWLCISLA